MIRAPHTTIEHSVIVAAMTAATRHIEESKEVGADDVPRDEHGAIAYVIQAALGDFNAEHGDAFDEAEWTNAAESAIETISTPETVAGYLGAWCRFEHENA